MNAPLSVLTPLADLPPHDFGLENMLDCFFGACEEQTTTNVIDLGQWRARKAAKSPS